jgi:hypothetical protein
LASEQGPNGDPAKKFEFPRAFTMLAIVTAFQSASAFQRRRRRHRLIHSKGVTTDVYSH